MQAPKGVATIELVSSWKQHCWDQPLSFVEMDRTLQSNGPQCLLFFESPSLIVSPFSLSICRVRCCAEDSA